ncbi:MAG: winged helix DNA-binding domain-containing protein, partial [Candidatus Dormibacteraeota bacterium]|nr:winged helix DNA-binding domain-containing protein [Candidatus Dormibacteraeota bacterium]
MGVRVDCRVEDVRNALWKHKTLVKTWLMRGTLHLVPAEDLPLYTAAMRTRWIRVNNSWLKFVQLSEQEFLDLIDAIGKALDGEVRTREELIAKVGKGRSERIREVLKSGWGMILKPVARRGLLCFGPSRGQSVTFVKPQQWLGTWREVDPDQALVEVARRYLRAYGPATKYDFARWWGNWPGVGNAAWSGLAGELAPVSVEGQRADVLASDLRAVARKPPAAPVQLLPPFDPYLMGHATRDHLFDS